MEQNILKVCQHLIASTCPYQPGGMGKLYSLLTSGEGIDILFLQRFYHASPCLLRIRVSKRSSQLFG